MTAEREWDDASDPTGVERRQQIYRRAREKFAAQYAQPNEKYEKTVIVVEREAGFSTRGEAIATVCKQMEERGVTHVRFDWDHVMDQSTNLSKLGDTHLVLKGVENARKMGEYFLDAASVFIVPARRK